MKKESSLHKTSNEQNKNNLIHKDPQFQRNSLLIGKMFGNMAQSININNSKQLNPSKNFAGGFKNISKVNNQQKQSNNNLSFQNKSKTDKFTVYDQFGLISENMQKNSKSKPKYRQDQTNNNQQNFVYQNYFEQNKIIKQMKQNRKKQLQKVLNNNYVNLHQYYQINNQKQRQQTAIHVKSSLQTMTLQNVQAKLQAHRRQMQNIENQYKNKKNNLSPSKQFQNSKKQNNLYKVYGKTQDQIYEMIKKNQKDDQKQLQMQKLWQQKVKQNPKIAEYSKKYEQYLVQKDAKNLLFGTVRDKIYRWDRFTQPEHQKSKTKPINKVSKQKSKTKYNKSNQKIQQNLSHNQSFHQKDIGQVLASKDDKFIAKYIFATIDNDKKGLLSKQQLLQYITKNQHIIKSYNIDLKWIYTDLDNFKTKRKGMLNKQQLSIFLSTFQRIQHPQIKLTNVSQITINQKSNLKTTTKSSSAFQVLFAINSYHFRKLFEALDLNDDKLLKRQQFIQNIYIDTQCSKILDQIVIKINIIQRNITYRQMISYILDDYRKQRNQKLKKSKQYITFDRFCQYFSLPQIIDLKYFNKKNNKKNNITNQHEIFDLQPENINILKDVFDTIPRVYQDYIVTADFIQTALVDPLVLSFQQDMCRIQSVQTNLSIQTVRLTLQRMIKQSDQYIDWDTAKCFFSRRGRPLEWNIQLINNKKSIREQKRIQSINETLKKQLILKNEFQISNKIKIQYASQSKKKSENNYTIPQPFKLTQNNKSNIKSKQVQQGEKQFKFKAKPINKQILQPKPQLIEGKVANNSSKKIEYNYQNYENDRIQRALKKAQQQFRLQQQKKKIKQQSNIKNWVDGLKLITDIKKYIKPKQNNRQNSRLKQQKPPLSQVQQKLVQRLFKKVDKKQLISKKQKIRQQAIKNKQKYIQQQLAKNKVKKDQKKYQQKNEQFQKKKQLQQQQLAQIISKDTFKPKRKKKKSLTQKEKVQLQKYKQQKQRKKLQQLKKAAQAQQKRRKKILQRQTKDPYNKQLSQQLQNIKQLNEQKKNLIFQKIYDIKIQNILFQQDIYSFQIDHQIKNKGKKQRQIYFKGVSNKFKLIMDQQKNVIDQNRIKQKQKQNIQNIHKIKKQLQQTGKNVQVKYKQQLQPNKSRALRRYRELMKGTAPQDIPSQFDKYSVKQQIPGQHHINKKKKYTYQAESEDQQKQN